MRDSIIGLALCAAALSVGSAAEAQPAPQQPPVAPQQPPVAGQPAVGGQGQVVVQGDGQVPPSNGQTIIVVQGNGQAALPRKRRRLPVVEGEAPPAGYHVEQKPLIPLAIAGWSVFGAGYLLSILSGAVVAVSHDCNLFNSGQTSCGVNDSGYIGLIPVVGSWIYTANNSFNGGARIWFAFTGVMQTGGLAMAIAGHAAHTDVWVSDEAKNPYGPRFGFGPTNISFTTNF